MKKENENHKLQYKKGGGKRKDEMKKKNDEIRKNRVKKTYKGLKQGKKRKI